VIDPAAFGGLAAFRRESGWLADACRASRVRPGDPPVRLPGERGLALRADQMARGVALYPGVMEGLEPWIDKLKVAPPAPV
jgi:L-lactate dehydrogenase